MSRFTRKTLRGPFFGECYPASIFCLVFGVGGTMARAWPHYSALGVCIAVLAALWYLGVQIVWLKRFNSSWARAGLVAVSCFLKASFAVLLVAVAIGLALLD